MCCYNIYKNQICGQIYDVVTLIKFKLMVRSVVSENYY